MTERELLERTKQFALCVFTLVGALPRTIQGKAVAAQLIRSGTSVAANYRAGCRARSKAEFVAKLGLVEEEAVESAFWLRVDNRHGLAECGTREASFDRGRRDRRADGRIEENCSQIANCKS